MQPDALPDAWANPVPPPPPPKAPEGELPAIELTQSKVLARLRYDPAALSLVAEFRNGSVYRYFGVSRDDYTVLATSASPGARFNTNIAPYHEHERLA
jgi:hypothetical protein